MHEFTAERESTLRSASRGTPSAAPGRGPSVRTLLVPGTALALLVTAAPPAGAESATDPPPPPVAQAFDGNRPLPSVAAVTSLCGRVAACSFRVQTPAVREYLSAVMSLGNAAINCANTDMDITRTVTFENVSTDNIGGEITGKATIEGWVDGNAEVNSETTGVLSTEASHNQWGAQKDKGPTTEDLSSSTTKNTTTAATKNNLHLNAKATFIASFKGFWNHEWKKTTTETTEVNFKVSPEDEVQFGVLNAMVRTAGTLSVDGTGKLVKNIAVESPSTTNVSSIVAQTFTNPDKCLTLRPRGRVAGLPAAHRPLATYLLTRSGQWVRLH